MREADELSQLNSFLRPSPMAIISIPLALRRAAARLLRLFFIPWPAIGLPKNLRLMVVEWCGVGVLCEGSSDGHASILLSCFQARRFRRTASDEDWADFTDIPYVMPANDNTRTKDRLSARCGALLRRLITLHSFT